MSFRSSKWAWISLLCLIAAVVSWRLGRNWEQRHRAPSDSPATNPAVPTRVTNATVDAPARPASITSPAPTPVVATTPAPTNPFPYRLSNATKTISEWIESERAILLRHALVDTEAPLSLDIPPHLRAQGDPGAYVVQAAGAIDEEFRDQLRAVGAEIISYVPNNAYLVQLSPAGAAQLAGRPGVRALLPWEPYYKLDFALMPVAIAQRPLPRNWQLNLVFFPGDREAILRSLATAGIEVVGEERTPFGPQFVVRAPADALVALAQRPDVQALELHRPRVLANDLSRGHVRVATNTTTLDSYQGPASLPLTGADVLVNVNDTGVEETHPDLMGRVISNIPGALTDGPGHGTHVAGIIASDGDDPNNPKGENVPGSFTNANYRGMAPKARIFVQPLNLAVGPASDTALQENAARTNALISNNSWSYGVREYNFASASWDAAVRDALPGQSNAQPLVVVFAAGNSGGGNDEGSGGGAGSIDSPSNGKNVITVGALESFRNITNEVSALGMTNQPWLGQTDSSNIVVSFSGRGNVAPGIEGEFGRAKPDLVAPGTFVVSTRSSEWVDPEGGTGIIPTLLTNQVLGANRTNYYTFGVPPEGTNLTIQLSPTPPLTDPLPPLRIWAANNPLPGPGDEKGINFASFTVTPGDWTVAIVNENRDPVRYDLRAAIIVTNDAGTFYAELKKLNDLLAPNYRFESGTSMSAAVVSGLLALMQEYFVSRGRTNSPALMKALLISGARSGGPVQSPAGYLVKSTRNPYGWGVPNLTNSLPSTLADSTGPLLMWDSGPSNALATGQSFTRVINIANPARAAGLRFTLVWTDPPGNPAVGLKLVNDLDLIVTNLATGEIHVGNDITPNSLYNRVASSATVTNTLPTDRVNNVENVFLRPGLATSYSVTVRARRVNVNAVSQHTNNVVQDFALVVASERTALASALSVGGEGAGWDPHPPLVVVTNGIPILNQRVAANPPLIGGTNGVTNQWNFYVVTNTPPDGSSGAMNIAFTTFFPPQLSRLRNSQDGDLDMFVSENPAITNLDAAALATAFRSTGRGGTESVVLTNATPEALYYVAIKSEDQQAVNFGFFAISSLSPFSQQNDNGEIIAQGFPAIVEIPDGSPEFQQAAIMFAFVVQTRRVQNAVAEVEIVHENGGDLVAKLSHNQRFAVLYNHRQFEGIDYTLFDDGDSGENEGSLSPLWRVSSGPETLKTFIGEEAVGVWQLNVFDLAPGLVGRIESLVLRITPEPEDLLGDDGLFVSIKSQRWFYFAVDVPADATNLVVCAAPDAGPVEVYLRREEIPTRDLYDVFATIAPPGDCLNLSLTDSPPLSRGRYYVGVFNPNATAVTVNLKARVERDLALRSAFNYRATNSVALLDDAVTNSTIFVNRRGTIADVSVGVRIDHDRVSDLVLHLISPSGTRLLLAENRGGALATNYGAGVLQTNVSAQDASGGFQANTNSIGPVQPVGVVEVDYEFYGIPDQLRIYYENELIFDTGLISGAGKVSVDFGPGSATNVVIVMNEGGNPNLDTAWNYTAVVLSGMSFTRFSDSAALPIKFAVPPFGNTNAFQPTTTRVSDFEMPTAGKYQAPPPQVIDGWDLVTNRVSVVRNPALAHTGNQFLALASGQMRRVLATTAGRDYRLSFAHRTPCLVSWWPGEGSPEDIFGDNDGVQAGGAYSPGLVGRAFDFTGPADGISIPPSATLNVGTNEGLAIEMWVRPQDLAAPMPLFAWTDGLRHGVSLWLSHPSFGASGSISAHFDAPTGPIGYLVAGTFAQAGVYQHIALTYDANTGRADLYVNGSPAGSGTFSTGPPLTTGTAHIGFSSRMPLPLDMPGTYFFRGQLDEVTLYHCALTEPQIAAIHAAGALGKCGASGCLPGFTLMVDDNTYEFSSEGGWQRNSARFTAVTNGSVVTLTGGAFSSLLDDFELTELPFEPTYQPEEPLKPLAGEEAFGDWTLEVWDNRVGAALTNGTLLSWRLGLTFVNTNPPVIPLTNGLPYTNSVGPGQIVYFVVQVPAAAAHATNSLLSLTGGPLDLLYNQGALPSGRGRNDFFLLDDVTEGATDVSVLGSTEFDDQWMVIDSRALPRLRPGRRYYLGVRNTPPQPGVTNQFVLRVDFDHTDADLGSIVSLRNGGCVSGTVVAGGTDYYQLDVLSNAVTVSLSLTNLDGNADLVARRYLPLPDLGFHDYGSFNGGTTNEFIRIEDFSYQLLPGRWYLGVVNRDATPVSYDLCASQFATDVICLTDQPYTKSVAPGAVQYYKVDILPRSTEAYFWVTNLAVPEAVELYVANRLPFPPGPTNFCYLGTNLHAVSESVAVTNDTRPCPLVPGPWYLAVTNLTGAAQSYVVQVFQTNGLVCLTNRIAYTDFVPAGGTNYYKFEMETNALQAEFELFGMATDLNLYVLAATNAFTPRPGPTNFTYASTNQLITNEFIRVWDTNTLDSINLPAGDWFVAVVNTNAGGSPFALRATQLRVPQEIVYLDNNLRRRNLGPTNALPHSGFHYYAYRAASNTVQLRIDVFNLSTNVDLYGHKNLPVPGPARYSYRSINGGLATETIILGTNSGPPALSAGDWFFAVSNATAGIARYSIQVTEITTDELRVLQNGLARCDTVAATNGLPTVGTNLYLFTVSSNAAQVLFETFNANGNVDLFVTPGLPLGDASTFPINSTTPGTANEAVVVVTNGTPLALTPGVWGLAVVNRDVAPVDYCVRATEIATNQIIRLTDGVPHTDTVPGASTISSRGIDYFLFTVSGGPVQVSFETFAADGNVDLYVTKTFPLPALTAFPYASTHPGQADEFIAVTPASAPVALSDGDWYLAVANREVADVNYSVRATQIFPAQITTLTDGVARADSVDPAPGAGSIDYYVFTVDAAALQADFVVYENTGDVDLYLRHGLPLPGENSFDYASANPGATTEWISLNSASAPVALAAGDWYLAVVNRESGVTPYTIRATQTLPGDIVVLTNASPYTNTAVAAGADYYLFTVSNTSVRAQFEVLGPDGDVTLAVRRGLPLPSRTLFDYLSDAPGTNNERVLFFTNSTPPLTAGDWYLAVLNEAAVPTTYAVRAMEFETTGTNLVVTGVTITSNAFCLSWTNALVGLTYLIEGKAVINDPIWLPAAPLVTATNTFMVYCIPLPSPFSFFRVREYLAPTNSVSAPQLTVVSSPGPLTNGFSFTWTAPANLQFAVQWADAPATNTWRFHPRRITSTNGVFHFTDDGSRTGGLGAQRFYRVLLAP